MERFAYEYEDLVPSYCGVLREPVRFGDSRTLSLIWISRIHGMNFVDRSLNKSLSSG